MDEITLEEIRAYNPAGRGKPDLVIYGRCQKCRCEIISAMTKELFMTLFPREKIFSVNCPICGEEIKLDLMSNIVKKIKDAVEKEKEKHVIKAT